MTAEAVISSLKKISNKKQAELLMRFFRTGKGQYGEGDIFMGVMVPELRKIAAKFKFIPLSQIKKLLKSELHECRLTALIILADQYDKGTNIEREKIFKTYLSCIKYINNWDLVDQSAPRIVGRHLSGKNRGILYTFAKSPNLWKRRIGIISTLYFIVKDNDFKDTMKISEILLPDRHDLIHKAVGWMLREVGKRDKRLLRKFLDKNYGKMSRTTLRYSIERFPYEFRMYYLNKK